MSRHAPLALLEGRLQELLRDDPLERLARREPAYIVDKIPIIIIVRVIRPPRVVGGHNAVGHFP